VIELKNIKKSFRVGDSSVEILHGVNLSVKSESADYVKQRYRETAA